jgi:hypothetical protein
MASQNPDDCQCEDNPKGKVICFDCWLKKKDPEMSTTITARMYAALVARRKYD